VLTVSVDDNWVRILVEDGDQRLPTPSTSSGPHGGFGLHIVERLAHAWGTTMADDGKAVWFELPLRPVDRLDTNDELHRALG
jgi:hypothetical protein